jgi:hypothetical protein
MTEKVESEEVIESILLPVGRWAGMRELKSV